jgi:Zn-dependent M16 (insulinase) family peptidase
LWQKSLAVNDRRFDWIYYHQTVITVITLLLKERSFFIMSSNNNISTTTTKRSGPQSSTEWDITTSPLFTVLGSEISSPTAIQSYHSPRTSLRGLVVTTDEPICSLHIVLSTESNGGHHKWHHPDDGLPHTLEHLVFLGSQTHPHKGVLDKLANRCMADGTNAWTATDHTAYTLSTAGSEGAINLLPIFADHVLFPTITDAGFVTEVHHVNGQGENKGVVYCEMQGRENSEGSLVDRACMELLYPTGSCGYSAETGGKMSNLRTLTVEKVRRYHREYYTPDNTILVLTGNVQGEEFFQALDEVEALILKRREEGQRQQQDATISAEEKEGYRVGRPWIDSPIPPMVLGTTGVYPPYDPSRAENDASMTPLTISFPSDDESRGTISIAWRGPNYQSKKEWTHLSLIWDYLTDSAASPLQLAFVENDEPMCADLGPAHDIFTEGYHQLWFQEVEVDRMDEVLPLFYKVVAREAGVIDGDDESSFDLTRMRTVIRRIRRRLLEASERRPTRAIMDGIIRNFMYGPRAGEAGVTPEDEMAALHSDVNALPYLDDAEGLLEDASYWQGLMKKYILDRPMAVVLGKPSAEMSKQISDGEKERESKQAEELGEEGLSRLAKTLEEAMEKNEEPIPEEILLSLPVPNLEKVPSIPLFTARLSPSMDGLPISIIPESVRGFSMDDAEALAAQMTKDVSKATAAPFHADLTHIDSAFVFAAVGIDTTPLNTKQRLYLPILEEILFKLPATLEDGTQLSKDEFVNQLQDETVSYSSGLGLFGGSIPQMSYISVQVENTDGKGLANALRWIRRALFCTNITEQAVKTAVQRLISEIPPQIRHGPSIAATVAAVMNYDESRSNSIACNVLRQKPFLSKIFEDMNNSEGSETNSEGGSETDTNTNAGIQAVIEELEGIRKELFQTVNMHAFVAANLRIIPNLLDTLVTSLAGDSVATEGRLIENVSASSVLKTKDPNSSGGEGAVCALSAIESGFLNIMAPGIKAYDANRAALLVAIEYLTALEGDFWVKLRGAGLTYSYSISDSTDSQLLKFSLFKCADSELYAIGLLVFMVELIL